jgi:hypothetical protein
MMKIDVRALIGKLLAIALLLVALAAIVGCSQQKQPSGDNKNIDAVAQSSPKLVPLPPTPPPKPSRPRVASQGDCAPRYPGGGRGTCINNQPCRGFGVRGEDGNAVCTCYGRDGGCAEGQRCDGMRLACVPEKELPFGRGRAD